MALKKIYQILSILSIIFGAGITFSSKITVLGAITGIQNMTSSTRLEFSIFFIVAGIALFVIQSKDNNLK